MSNTPSPRVTGTGSWCTVRIDKNQQDAIWTSDRDRHFEATPSGESACAFRDEHKAISRIDRLDEPTERKRSLDALGDGVGNLCGLGPETLRFCSSSAFIAATAIWFVMSSVM